MILSRNLDHTSLPVEKPLLRALQGDVCKPPPVWLMRQAGRYLPEYREIRARAGSFLDLCFTPALAAEVTLQPIRRFMFDAAIIFSDILVVPIALGRDVSFEEGEGPRLEPLADGVAVARMREELDHAVLAPIYETISRVKSELPPGIALLGFCGAPWTVAGYMVAGRGTGDQKPARLFAYRDRVGFSHLIDVLVDASVEYLAGQFEAGVDAVQIFDSWAGLLADDEFQVWCIEPTRRLVTELRRRVPNAQVIGFPRGAGTSLLRYVENIPLTAVSLDWTVSPSFAREHVQARLTVQGNLDPLALLAGGLALDRAADRILEALADGAFIFNLGHGILPETPISHVEQLLTRVRGFRAA